VSARLAKADCGENMNSYHVNTFGFLWLQTAQTSCPQKVRDLRDVRRDAPPGRHNAPRSQFALIEIALFILGTPTDLEEMLH
jgi:hypothetical protein